MNLAVIPADMSVDGGPSRNQFRVCWWTLGRPGFGLAACALVGLTFLLQAHAVAQDLPSPVVAIDFDRLAQGELPQGVSVHTQFRAPDVVPGVLGDAWRADGFSSYAEAPLALNPKTGFTVSLWVALESYPSDLEVPPTQLSPSSIAQQWSDGAGFDLFVDTYGRWGFKVATSAGVISVPAQAKFPLSRWAHVVASVDPQSGFVRLYLNGEKLGESQAAPGMSVKLAPVPLRLATPERLVKILNFKVNRLNAAYDLVNVYPTALVPAQFTQLPGPAGKGAPDARASLIVPASRFAADVLRPRVHPMPPANWTNEPHGLIRAGGVWHMFYQRTPNGPFKTQMHWGHLVSRDLVNWEPLPDALRPELQNDKFGFDMKGIWSGHVITDGGKAFAFYTSVNHGDRLAASNPGIAMAVSEDADLREWRKLGPVLNTSEVKDFRDPYLWKEGDSWHMIIGAALETGGGLEYLVLKASEKGARWQHQRRFIETSYRMLDIGSVIWEMPVFEKLSDRVWVLVVNPIGGKISKYGEPATRSVYWTGEWSGGLFKPYFNTPRNLDLVPGHLAPTVGRAADGSLRVIGIVDERRTPPAQERAGWANAFGLPRVWTLMPDQRTLGQAPAPELAALRGERQFANKALSLGNEPTKLAQGLRAYELLVDLDEKSPPSGVVTIDVLASEDSQEVTRLVFDPIKGLVTVDKSRSSLSHEDEGPQVLQGEYATEAFGPMRSLRVLVDGSVIEVFVNDAAAYSVRSYPSLPGSTQARISVAGHQEALANVQLWPLRRPPGADTMPLRADGGGGSQ